MSSTAGMPGTEYMSGIASIGGMPGSFYMPGFSGMVFIAGILGTCFRRYH